MQTVKETVEKVEEGGYINPGKWRGSDTYR